MYLFVVISYVDVFLQCSIILTVTAQLAVTIFLVMSTPVMARTVSGSEAMISRTSPVTLLAPTAPSPVLTIVIFFTWDTGLKKFPPKVRNHGEGLY